MLWEGGARGVFWEVPIAETPLAPTVTLLTLVFPWDGGTAKLEGCQDRDWGCSVWDVWPWHPPHSAAVAVLPSPLTQAVIKV